MWRNKIPKVWLVIGIVLLVGMCFWITLLLVTDEKRNADMVVYVESGLYGEDSEREYIKDEGMESLIDRIDFLGLPDSDLDKCKTYGEGGNVVVVLPKKYGTQRFWPCRVNFPEEMLEYLRGRGYKV